MVNENLNIEEMIYEVRGQHVMLDSDLARLFKYETKNLNRNFKNNIDKFLEGNVFQLTNEEIDKLRCTRITSSDVFETSSSYGGRDIYHILLH